MTEYGEINLVDRTEAAMRVFAIGSVCLLVSLGFGPGSIAQTPQKPAPRVIELTPEKNGKDIKVRVGDQLVLKLPIQAPFDWGLTKQLPELKESRTPLEIVPAGTASGDDQVVGAPGTCRLRYRLVKVPKDPSIEWVYCLHGKAIINGEPIKPTEPLKPDEIPSKRGTYFRVKLIPNE